MIRTCTVIDIPIYSMLFIIEQLSHFQIEYINMLQDDSIHSFDDCLNRVTLPSDFDSLVRVECSSISSCYDRSSADSSTSTILNDRQHEDDSRQTSTTSEHCPSKPSRQTIIYYQDMPYNAQHLPIIGYVSFASKNSKTPLVSTETNSNHSCAQWKPFEIKQDPSNNELDLHAWKKQLFPTNLSMSFVELAGALRDERRQEFSPIYEDDTSSTIVLRRQQSKPIGSLLAKRIRWDDLKRKREALEQVERQHRQWQYAPIYNSTQQHYHDMSNQYEQVSQSKIFHSIDIQSCFFFFFFLL
jgi:hypothetical protein